MNTSAFNKPCSLFCLNWQNNDVIRTYSLCESVNAEYISWLIYEPLENMVDNEIQTDPLQNYHNK